MIFKETGNSQMATIILLHGGGLSFWSWQKTAEQLRSEFHVVTPIIDGHGENGNEEFISIQDSARKIIKYIDLNHNGRVFAICGLSIGAQIIIEILSQRPEITEYAVIESALVYKIRGIRIFCALYNFLYGLIKIKWFSKLQAKALNLPEYMFDMYYEDSQKMSKPSLINITLSNGNYSLKNSIQDIKSKVLIILGEKETRVMRKSGQKLHEAIENSQLYISPGMGHGELSLVYPDKYTALVKSFFARA